LSQWKREKKKIRRRGPIESVDADNVEKQQEKRWRKKREREVVLGYDVAAEREKEIK